MVPVVVHIINAAPLCSRNDNHNTSFSVAAAIRYFTIRYLPSSQVKPFAEILIGWAIYGGVLVLLNTDKHTAINLNEYATGI